jgi:LacI family transcriptional regulator
LYTIRDITRLAEVSVATVSKVLNNKLTVKPKLVQQVKQAVEALDYPPDHGARSLRVRRTVTAGRIVADVTNPFFTEVIRGIEQAAELSGYSVILFDTNEDEELEKPI